MNKEAKPLSRQFLASLMRAMDKSATTRAANLVSVQMSETEERIKAAVNDELKRRTPVEHLRLLEKYTKLITGMGFTLEDFQWCDDMTDVAKAYRVLSKGGLGGIYNGFKYTLERLDDSAQKLRDGLKQYELEVGDKNKNAVKYFSKK